MVLKTILKILLNCIPLLLMARRPRRKGMQFPLLDLILVPIITFAVVFALSLLLGQGYDNSVIGALFVAFFGSPLIWVVRAVTRKEKLVTTAHGAENNQWHT